MYRFRFTFALLSCYVQFVMCCIIVGNAPTLTTLITSILDPFKISNSIVNARHIKHLNTIIRSFVAILQLACNLTNI